MEWNRNLNWQPIPYVYESLNQDSLLLVRVKCPRYYEELQNVFDNELSEMFNKNTQLFENLSIMTGLSVKTPDEVQSLFSTLRAEVNFKAFLSHFFSFLSFSERVRHRAS
jgi:prostatic aicd phosphatase